jgi:hypothetical protein
MRPQRSRNTCAVSRTPTPPTAHNDEFHARRILAGIEAYRRPHLPASTYAEPAPCRDRPAEIRRGRPRCRTSASIPNVLRRKDMGARGRSSAEHVKRCRPVDGAATPLEGLLRLCPVAKHLEGRPGDAEGPAALRSRRFLADEDDQPTVAAPHLGIEAMDGGRKLAHHAATSSEPAGAPPPSRRRCRPWRGPSGKRPPSPQTSWPGRGPWACPRLISLRTRSPLFERRSAMVSPCVALLRAAPALERARRPVRLLHPTLLSAKNNAGACPCHTQRQKV